ncbi:DUF3566 domain-containing protein [Patescibacteria group bacterium]|nr:DUF3566 domain-containing protein [Patescibacteria group bacterium]
MKKVKKIGVLSLGKFQAILGALVGLLLGIIYIIFFFLLSSGVSTALDSSSSTMNIAGLLNFGKGLAILFGLIILPLIFAGINFVNGIISALVYNLIARLVGGIEMDLEDVINPPFIPGQQFGPPPAPLIPIQQQPQPLIPRFSQPQQQIPQMQQNPQAQPQQQMFQTQQQQPQQTSQMQQQRSSWQR